MAKPSDLLQGLRVLVVEDEGLIAEELGERLTRRGMTVVASVDSADAAVRSAVELQPDLVLMDIRIKGARDGVQAAAEIAHAVDVPIVYLTAHSDRATLDRALVTAPFGYVVKPFQEQELLVAMEMAVHRHALERLLKESERKYVATLASIGDAVVATDINGCITFMNPVAEALTGWSFAEARGRQADEVVQVAQDVQGKATVSPIGQALRENKSIRFDESDLFLFSKSNEAIPIDDCAAPIVDDRGHVTGGVVAFRDIRDRRLAEDALRQAQEELHQSQKMEAVGRMAAGIAHDFNNLLTVVNGCTELALASGLDETTRELLGQVITAGRRATILTRQFLAFGRKQVLSPRIVDLTALVVNLSPMLARLVGQGVELPAAAGPPSHVLVIADPSQLEHVIVNLAVNARDAMPDGGVLTIATLRRTVEAGAPDSVNVDPGRYAVLTVSDTGHGIAAAVKNQIFEPYFTTKAFGASSGLGLATVYGIVKQSDGFIEVDSEPGRGTTFSIYLPLVENAESAGASAGAADARVVARGSETVLLVESEEAVRLLLASVLRKLGYTLIVAADAGGAVLAVRDHTGPIHLVVTDVVIPRMKGRVLYMAVQPNDGSLATRDVAFIQKPFMPSSLARKARELLDG